MDAASRRCWHREVGCCHPLPRSALVSSPAESRPRGPHGSAASRECPRSTARAAACVSGVLHVRGRLSVSQVVGPVAGSVRGQNRRTNLRLPGSNASADPRPTIRAGRELFTFDRVPNDTRAYGLGRRHPAPQRVPAFLDLSGELGPEDFIVKVDSDILFTADWLFPRLLRPGADLIGQPVSSFATHTVRDVPDVQGGCYWLRAGAVFQLRSASLLAAARAVVKTSRYDLWTVPEDRTISQWAHNAKLKVHVEDYYLLDLARLRSRPFSSDTEIEACLSQPTPFGVIHFERCKAKMAPCFEWLTRSERACAPPSSMASRR